MAGQNERPGSSSLGIRINPRLLELQTAKEILAEIFHARPDEVEEMIQSSLKERRWRNEKERLG